MSFYSEVHWFQDLNAAILLINAILCYFLIKSNRLWILASAFFLVLSLDEYYVVHECLKISLFRGHHSTHLLDYVILIYGGISIASGVYLIKKEKNDWIDLCLIGTSFLAVTVILATDVFNLFQNQALEESLEFLVSLLVTFYIIRRLPKIKMIKGTLVSSVYVVVFLISGYLLSKYLHNNVCKLPVYLLEKSIWLKSR